MDNFCIESHLESIYATYPEACRRPVIGITANYTDGDAQVRDRYYRQVVEAGGVPLLIPPVADKAVIINTLDRIDGLLLTGGGDYNPLWMGEEPEPVLGSINAERDLPELLITRLAYNRQIPMLGICRGIQTLAVALGGKVSQHIETPIKHSQQGARDLPTHSVRIQPASVLHDLYPEEQIYVNSFHHQAVKDTGPLFRATALAPDGVVEAMESTRLKDVLGVQWHPEWLGEDGGRLFRWLVDRAAEFGRAKQLHDRMLTLDTHCDTPMFFPQGVDFGRRDSRILVDLHKMADGRLDATTMVAYLPQPKAGETWTSVSPLPADTPTAYADLIFDKIGGILQRHADYIRQARTPEDLYRNKRERRKSIMLGIENGLAIGSDLANIAHFAQRGAVYITLCHNGDNAICDSARGSATHGGVSAFGEQVIHEMNRQGLMVDLSHAAESSFYDALSVSETPIVCSHSCCKALCDVPRNLTDDQLRALAARGGVAHITLYPGFLRRQGEATLHDALDHLRHAVDIMGIDHVGLGTDFDGDGGVPGMADAAEAIRFTLYLLRQRYSEEDICKIWGGNWLRVMTQVQQHKHQA